MKTLPNTRGNGEPAGDGSPEPLSASPWGGEETPPGDSVAARMGRSARSPEPCGERAHEPGGGGEEISADLDLAPDPDEPPGTDNGAAVARQSRGESPREDRPPVSEARRFEEHFIDLPDAVCDWRFADKLGDWEGVMAMIGRVMDATRDIGFDQPHEDDEDDGPCTGWNATHFAVCDFLQECMPNEDVLPSHVFEKHRATFLAFIRRLVEITSAPAVMGSPCRVPWRVYDADSRSYVLAAQTLRAKAIGALVTLMVREEAVSGRGVSAIPAEIKELFGEIVSREGQPSPMFQLGRCFRHLHLRDAGWARGLMGKVFSEAREDRCLFIAAWAGFVTGVPTRGVFFDAAVQDLLDRGISLSRLSDLGDFGECSAKSLRKSAVIPQKRAVSA